MPPWLKRTTRWRNRSPDLDNFSIPCRLAENASAGAAMAGPSLPRPPALHQLHHGRTGPIGPDRCQYNLLNPRRGIMMRIMQSFHTRARRRRNARVPVDIWRKPSGPTAPRSGNMSFSHCPARHPFSSSSHFGCSVHSRWPTMPQMPGTAVTESGAQASRQHLSTGDGPRNRKRYNQQGLHNPK